MCALGEAACLFLVQVCSAGLSFTERCSLMTLAEEVAPTGLAALGWGVVSTCARAWVLVLEGLQAGAPGGPRGPWGGQLQLSPRGQGPLKRNPREAVPFLLFRKRQRQGPMKHVKNAKEKSCSQVPESAARRARRGSRRAECTAVSGTGSRLPNSTGGSRPACSSVDSSIWCVLWCRAAASCFSNKCRTPGSM